MNWVLIVISMTVLSLVRARFVEQNLELQYALSTVILAKAGTQFIALGVWGLAGWIGFSITNFEPYELGPDRHQGDGFKFGQGEGY